MRPRDVAEMGEGKRGGGGGEKPIKLGPVARKLKLHGGKGGGVFIRYLEKHDKLPLLREIFLNI